MFIAALMILMTQGFNYGIGTFTITLVVVMIMALIIFIYMKNDKSTIHRFFNYQKQSFLGSTINNFVVNTGTGTTVVFNVYAQKQLGLTEMQTGLVIVPYTIMAVAMIRLGELAIKRYGGKSMLIAGPLFPTLGIMLISMTSLTTHLYIAIVTIAYVICAIGNGLVATPGLTIAILICQSTK